MDDVPSERLLASLNANDDCPHFEPHLTAHFGHSQGGAQCASNIDARHYSECCLSPPASWPSTPPRPRPVSVWTPRRPPRTSKPSDGVSRPTTTPPTPATG